VRANWSAPAPRAAIDATRAFADGSRAAWVIGSHDEVRPVTRWGSAAARTAALLLLALPGPAYIYQGGEHGLPEVTDIPGSAGAGSVRWLAVPDDARSFARDPGFLFLANLGPEPLCLPEFREVLLASGPLIEGGRPLRRLAALRHGRLAQRLGVCLLAPLAANVRR